MAERTPRVLSNPVTNNYRQTDTGQGPLYGTFTAPWYWDFFSAYVSTGGGVASARLDITRNGAIIASNTTNPVPPGSTSVLNWRIFPEQAMPPGTYGFRITPQSSAIRLHYGSNVPQSFAYYLRENVPAEDASQVPTGPVVQRWNGSTWAPATIKKWNGSTWANTTLTRY